MSYLVGQMLFCLFIALLLGIVLAWLWSKIAPPKVVMPDEGELAECKAALENLQAKHEECPKRLKKAHLDLQKVREDLTRTEERLKAYQRLHTPKLPAKYGGPEDEPTITPSPDSEDETSGAMAYAVLLDRAHRLQEALHRSQAELAALTRDTDGDGRPRNLLAKPPAKADNLEKISGVGPVLHRKLNQLGIYQFRQIADFSSHDIAWVSDQLKTFKHRITRDDWVGQARDLYNKQHGHQG